MIKFFNKINYVMWNLNCKRISTFIYLLQTHTYISHAYLLCSVLIIRSSGNNNKYCKHYLFKSTLFVTTPVNDQLHHVLIIEPLHWKHCILLTLIRMLYALQIGLCDSMQKIIPSHKHGSLPTPAIL